MSKHTLENINQTCTRLLCSIVHSFVLGPHKHLYDQVTPWRQFRHGRLVQKVHCITTSTSAPCNVITKQELLIQLFNRQHKWVARMYLGKQGHWQLLKDDRNASTYDHKVRHLRLPEHLASNFNQLTSLVCATHYAFNIEHKHCGPPLFTSGNAQLPIH